MLRYSIPKLKKLKKFNLTFLPGFSNLFNINKFNNLKDIKNNKILISYYFIELIEKQKFKFLYGLKEKNIKYYLSFIYKYKLNLNYIINLRLDVLLYNLGFATTICQARKLIVYGHILVNLKIIKKPSYFLKQEDIVIINPKSIYILRLCKYNLFIKYNTSFVSYDTFKNFICLKYLKFKIFYFNIFNYIKFKSYLIYNKYN